VSKKGKLEDYYYLIPRFGDIPIIFSLLQGQFWRNLALLLKGDFSIIIKVIITVITFFISVFATPIRMTFRYLHGSLTIGWFLIGFSGITMLFFNCNSFVWIWAPLLTILFPFRELYANAIEEDSIYPWWPETMTDWQSESLFWFTIIFVALSIIHILISYFTFKKDDRDIKHGYPIFWKLSTLLLKNLENKESHWIWYLLETLIVGIITIIFYYLQDIIFSKFLLIAGSCHFLSEFVEDLWKKLATIKK